MMPADALLFDLGGVLLGLDWDRAFGHWARHAATDAAALRSRYAFDAAYERHERGEIGEAEYYASLRRSLGIDIPDDEFRAGWGAIFTGEVAETTARLDRLHGLVPLYLFSNTNAAHHRVWGAMMQRTLARFDRVFVSSELGLRKPDRAAFDRIAREIGVPHPRILFFDDTPSNVEGARAAGLQAVHVRTPDDVREAVRPWLDKR